MLRTTNKNCITLRILKFMQNRNKDKVSIKERKRYTTLYSNKSKTYIIQNITF